MNAKWINHSEKLQAVENMEWKIAGEVASYVVLSGGDIRDW